MKSSLLGGSKFDFVRRVLSRTSSRSRSPKTSEQSNTSPNNSITNTSSPRKPGDMDLSSSQSSVKFQSELLLLKSQIENLQISVHNMQTDNASKDQELATVMKEKEQLIVDLKKQQRSNINLRQQLEDERNYYYKEKEQYCQEMNRIKQKHNTDNDKSIIPVSVQKEIAELKNTLNQTLEANYNLSVKFLRMKNTKLGLTKEITSLKSKHQETTKFFRQKVDEYEQQMDMVVAEEFFKPIPPSSKKYLHLLKHNGKLIHENLELQVKVDKLHHEIERLKLVNIRNEVNSKLKLIHHDDLENVNKSSNSPRSKTSHCSQCKCKHKNDRLKESRNATCSRSSQTPSVSISTSTRSISSKHRQHHHHHHKRRLSSSKSGKSDKSSSSRKSSESSLEKVRQDKREKLTATIATTCEINCQKSRKIDSDKFDLMTISSSNIDLQKFVNGQSQSSIESGTTSIESNTYSSSLEEKGAVVNSAPAILTTSAGKIS